MWDSVFPSSWYVWGHKTELDDRGEPFPRGFEVVFKSPGQSLSWARGIEMLVERVRSKTTCEYIFTHDDGENTLRVLLVTGNFKTPTALDLIFYARNRSSVEPLHQTLTRVLETYHPAVAAFPWQHGDRKLPAMIEMAQMFAKEQDVAPLTGFDSGMVLYHESVVELFIPYAPRGEGGFVGEWSLPAHVLNLFGPLVFREHAIRINALLYDNLINIDTVSDEMKLKSLRQAKSVQGSALIVRSESRHPYEYKMNGPFQKFLREGLKPHSRNWGRTLRPAEVTWRPKAGNPPWSPLWVLERIHEFYDVDHPLVRGNQYIRKHFTGKELDLFVRGTNAPQEQAPMKADIRDKCTLVLTVYDRLATFPMRLAYYHTFSELSSIVVIWNNPAVDPPSLNPSMYNVPIVILRQKRNSLNNRFLPHSEISSDCILNMDDDWDMPHEQMQLAVHVWREAFRDTLVGFRHQARTHIAVNGTWRYNRENKHGASLVLPSGLVYHRRFQESYSRSPPEALEMVDVLTNCDDILLNFVVANETSLCPVIIDVGKPGDSKSKPIAALGGAGLWKKTNGNHITERHQCIQTFAALYGYMPLRYSIKYFDARELHERARQRITLVGRDEQQCVDTIDNLLYTYAP
ncbi:Exostoses (Multiple)-like 3 [Gonapodya sp. JEL0774]|nr:Exostoses (Multiple)-like 3 [Gonapodya sp. JEL0774]